MMQTLVFTPSRTHASRVATRRWSVGDAVPPVGRQLLTWIVFWPLLCLIAHQGPIFSGPARDPATFSSSLGAESAPYHAWLYSMMAMQAAIITPAWRSIWNQLKQCPLIPAGLTLLFVSALWSGSPGNTFRIGIETTLCTLFIIYLVVRLSAERLMDLLILMGVIASLLSLAFALLLPSYGVFVQYAGGAWQGICNHKNTLGCATAYLLTPIFFSPRHGRLFKALYALLLLFMIYKSQSRGAWAGTAATLCFVAFLHVYRRLRQHESRLYVLVIASVAILTVALAVAYFDSIAAAFGKDPTMSGRSPIYHEVWSAIMKKPLLGYGYFGFWFIDPEAGRVALASGFIGIGYAESGILELALSLGFVGVALVAVMFLRAGAQAITLLRTPGAEDRVGWYATILFLTAMTNIDQGWLLMPYVLEWNLVLVACIGLETESRRLKASSKAPPRQILPAYA